MPRWARFLSCSFTALVLSLSGFLLTAYWYEGGDGYWRSLLSFMAEPGFWNVVSFFALMAVLTLLAARAAVHLSRLPSPVAGALAGGLVVLIGITVILSMHADHWGGLAGGLRRAWPAAAPFALPFVLSGGLVNWLWDRFD
ncbi:MAG TPA: hypothetical protein VIL07_10875 [Symbiobacteriaceae bacterium]